MLASKIAGYSFESCLMNAAGVHCQTAEELDQLIAAGVGAAVTKTATSQFRAGNVEPRFFSQDNLTINSMGLPNFGIDFYLDYLNQRQGQHFFLSVTGLSKEEIFQVLEKVQASDFQGPVELNLSCPNVIGKPQTGYDFELTDQILSYVFTFFTKPLGVKLPPYFDLAHFDTMAEILNKYPLKFVNSINSVGNGICIQDDRMVIRPKQGFGGIGGSVIKPTALANVHAFYQRLREDIAIIGTGGITCGQDAYEHILCGASMVQIGSQLMVEGLGVFQRIEEELKAIMQAKNYISIENFRGQLKYMED